MEYPSRLTEPTTPQPIAVVTGASSGFGEEIVRRLADEGWMTIGVARRGDRLAALAEEVGGDYVVCDITDPVRVRLAAGAILGWHVVGGRAPVNLLVNNAGMPLREHFDDADEAAVTEVTDTNYLGSFRMVTALLPGLEAAGQADIINVVSAAATITNPGSGPYGASKRAQLGYSQALAVDLRPRGINVHAILPGKADTEGHPQKESHSPLSRLTRTDIDSVADAVMDRIGKKPADVYVPKILKWVAVANVVAPVTTGRVVNKLIS